MKNPVAALSFFACLVLMGTISWAQEPEILWVKTFGGPVYDCAESVKQTSDGGFILAGSSTRPTSPQNRDDARLIKTDENGNLELARSFGGEGWDSANSVVQTQDGGYIVAGYTQSFGAVLRDLWLFKLDPMGNQVWSRLFGGDSSEEAYDVIQTSDGGYLVAGYTESFGSGQRDGWLIKTDANGIEEWSQVLGGTDYDIFSQVNSTSDGGYIVTGYTKSYGAGNYDGWIVKVDENGSLEWSQVFGGTNYDRLEAGQQTTDGGYIFAGYNGSLSYYYVAWLIKTDASGNEVWSQTWSIYAFEYFFRDVVQTPDGGYIITGAFATMDSHYNLAVVKTDSQGNEEWNQTFGGQNDEQAYDVELTDDGGYVVAGITYTVLPAGTTDMLFLKIGTSPTDPAITISPLNPPIYIPAAGGSFSFNAVIENLADQAITVDGWTEVDLPNGTTYGPVLVRQNLTIPAGGVIDVTLSQDVPGNIPTGEYVYRAHVGQFPNGSVNSSEFTFDKVPFAGTSTVKQWTVRKNSVSE